LLDDDDQRRQLEREGVRHDSRSLVTIGVDVGQRRHPTAIAVAEAIQA
jgi:hypothetical protein